MRTALKSLRRHPWITAGVAGPLFLLFIAWAWGRISLARIPDVGDPFDVAAFERDFPDDLADDDNAFHFYKQASAALPRGQRTTQGVAVVDDWTHAGDEWKERLEEARPALEIWRRGTDRDEAVYHRLDELRIDTLLPVTQELRSTFAHLALLEGSRRESEGDLAGAWGWYRALLRSSRHSGRNGCLIERFVGRAIRDTADERIRRWMADLRVDADLLREALADVRAADALTSDDLTPARLEYLITRRAIDDPKLLAEMFLWARQPQASNATVKRGWRAAFDLPGWMATARIRSGYEGERCRRLVQLLWANRLPQLARPPEARAAIASVRWNLYATDPTAPESSRAIDPATLADLLEKSPIESPILKAIGGTTWLQTLPSERATRAQLIADLEAEIARREPNSR